MPNLFRLRLRRNRHPDLVVSETFHLRNDPSLGFTGIRRGLSGCLIRSLARNLIDLGAGIPQKDLVGDVSLDGIPLHIEQRDALGSRSEEPVIGVHEH